MDEYEYSTHAPFPHYCIVNGDEDIICIYIHIYLPNKHLTSLRFPVHSASSTSLLLAWKYGRSSSNLIYLVLLCHSHGVSKLSLSTSPRDKLSLLLYLYIASLYHGICCSKSDYLHRPNSEIDHAYNIPNNYLALFIIRDKTSNARFEFRDPCPHHSLYAPGNMYTRPVDNVDVGSISGLAQWTPAGAQYHFLRLLSIPVYDQLPCLCKEYYTARIQSARMSWQLLYNLQSNRNITATICRLLPKVGRIECANAAAARKAIDLVL